MNNENPYLFRFNTELDTSFLQDLFDGDMEYAAQVFGDFLDSLPGYWQEVQQAYDSGNLPALKAAIHKCKTLFGYVGHTKMLNLVQTFENRCGTAREIEEIAVEYKELNLKRGEATEMIKEEYKRLQDHGGNSI